MIRFVKRRPRFVNRSRGNPSWKAIHYAADAQVGAVQRGVLDALAEARKAFPMAEVERAVSLRAPELAAGAVDFHALRTRIETAIVPALRACVVGGAKVAHKGLPVQKAAPKKKPPKPAWQLDLEGMLTLNNPEAIRLAAIAATRLSGNVSETTVRAIRDMLDRTLRGETDVTGLAHKIATDLRDGLGMTPQQANGLATYEAGLRKQGLADSIIRERVEAQRTRYIEDRALVIARNETMAATNAGQDALWRRAQENDLLPRDIEREWLTTPDARTCDICAPMNGVRAKTGENFPGVDVPYPPAHVQCRCVAVLVVPEVAEAA